MESVKGIVYLVGGGPGDPGLMTLKGLDCVLKADVLVYDRLAGDGLLSQLSPQAEKIYVGKNPGSHTMEQDEINKLLVDKALKGKTVTRLKGGDPFVFGRGGEEAEALYNAGISYEIVPGVTSAVAAPAYAGIPISHRGLSSSFAVITGNEDPEKDRSDLDWPVIARWPGTLVFLMGMGNLDKIARVLIKNGKPAGTPAAIIMCGSLPDQRTVTGTLENIAGLASSAGVGNPAVIVVGRVAGLAEKLKWFEKKPLFGCRVLITRTREQAGELGRVINDLGGEALEFPTIRIAGPEDYAGLDRAVASVSEYSWIVFTSVNGVKYFFDRLFSSGRDSRELKGVKIACIGPATCRRLEKYGIITDFMPSAFTAEKIASGLMDKISPGDKILLPRADIARKDLPELLKKAGAAVDEVPAYRTLSCGNGKMLQKIIGEKKIDIIAFTSSSAVKNFAAIAGEKILLKIAAGSKIACIGPVTAGTARELGLRVDIEAASYTINGLVEAIIAYWQSSGPGIRPLRR